MSSTVLVAHRMRAKRTSTPGSPRPQKALQKSRDLFSRSASWGRAYRDSDDCEDCRRALIPLTLIRSRYGPSWDIHKSGHRKSVSRLRNRKPVLL